MNKIGIFLFVFAQTGSKQALDRTNIKRNTIMLKVNDIVYIAGPMSGCKLFNYPAFFAMEGLLKKEFGCKVLNPARQPNGLTYEEYMKRAFEDVRKASVVVMLNNWTLSDGAQREYHLAKFEQIKVISQIQVEKFVHEKFRSEFGDLYKADE